MGNQKESSLIYLVVVIISSMDQCHHMDVKNQLFYVFELNWTFVFQAAMYDSSVCYEKANIRSVTMGEWGGDLTEFI